MACHLTHHYNLLVFSEIIFATQILCACESSSEFPSNIATKMETNYCNLEYDTWIAINSCWCSQIDCFHYRIRNEVNEPFVVPRKRIIFYWIFNSPKCINCIYVASHMHCNKYIFTNLCARQFICDRWTSRLGLPLLPLYSRINSNKNHFVFICSLVNCWSCFMHYIDSANSYIKALPMAL